MMVSKVGDDLFGQNTIKNLKNNGVNTDFVTVQKIKLVELHLFLLIENLKIAF